MKTIVLFFLTILWVPSLAQTTDSNNSIQSIKKYGLMFEKEIDYRLTDSIYTDIIQLYKLGDKAQAIQFRLLINKASDDSNMLVFKDIEKGSDLGDPSWLLDYNVIDTPVAENGGSENEIFVVLYNLNQDGGLLPGDYKNLFTVSYELVALPDKKNDIKSSLKISDAEASTFGGDKVNITSNNDEFKIYLKKSN